MGTRPFFDEGLITETLYMVKSGKEATVYCCRAHPRTGAELLAAKVYRPREGRRFKNAAVYREGEVILDTRARRAVGKKTRFGMEAAELLWHNREYETLLQLHRAGLDVPRPVRQGESAILMEYVGDADGAAPPLSCVQLDFRTARTLFEQVLHGIELCLAENLVHGDLSPYNILYWEERARIIDFPQAVDPRKNQNAYDLLERDLVNVCDYFAAAGVRCDPLRIARGLWGRWKYGEL